ncbi:TPA: M-related protein Enn [Streptococcus pyogenes]|uniref:M-related protein Enn n=1 Tax=Streptococcus pyogenes TaxID=1314 RepID=UPI0010A1A88E|nr:M-related protein Enn [Streptococcus pyogenes]VHF12684.1 M protein [Streptococcus pyogenes]HEQ4408403.1 M-related protein Enn [Streptococcus pyogenes]HEQ4590705.1 M-related protein Enn [Streptococcus pyogenes]HEQ4628283.1 M-related protein Enn [Streptococcus pyogenes]HER9128433.1 M-related protein Enn [Streptococcus pyogenes]
MARQQTKKNYSLRKLKTGTASVAVALTVLGAGFANQTEVRADEPKKMEVKESEKESQYKTLALRGENADLRNVNAKYLEKINAEEEKNKKLEATNKELNENYYKLQDGIDALEKEDLKTTLAKATKENEISEASRKGLSRDLEASRAAKKELEAKHQKLEAENKKLTEANQISEASRKGLSNDLEASRAAKKELEAKHQKLAEEHQVSETSRKGLSRDLEASREANKKVTSELTQAKAQLSALEESKKLSEKEKAELQAKLDAQGKALKEQLAKQTEELAKLRAEKAAGSKTPATKPANKERSGRAAQTATRPSQNKGMRSQLPSTGEVANPFFTAAAATVMVSAGMLALKRKEEN